MVKKILVISILLLGLIVAYSFGGEVPAKPFRGVGMITDAHAKIHMGEIYEEDFIDIAVDDDYYLVIMIYITTDTYTADEVHAAFEIIAGGDAVFKLYEGAHCTSSGTLITSYNLNRSIADSPEALIFHTPTVILTSGTAIVTELIAGGTGCNAGGGGYDRAEEVVLSDDYSYLVEVQNIAGSAKPLGACIIFYEALEP